MITSKQIITKNDQQEKTKKQLKRIKIVSIMFSSLFLIIGLVFVVLYFLNKQTPDEDLFFGIGSVIFSVVFFILVQIASNKITNNLQLINNSFNNQEIVIVSTFESDKITTTYAVGEKFKNYTELPFDMILKIIEKPNDIKIHFASGNILNIHSDYLITGTIDELRALLKSNTNAPYINKIKRDKNYAK